MSKLLKQMGYDVRAAKRKKTIYSSLSLCGFLSLALAACQNGQSVAGFGDSNSTSAASSGTTTTTIPGTAGIPPAANEPLANCAYFSQAQNQFSGDIEVYAPGRNIVDDELKLRFISTPASFTSNSSVYLQFQIWQDTIGGQPYYNPAILSVSVLSSDDSTTYGTGYGSTTALNMTAINSLNKTYGTPASLNGLNLHILGADPSYQALTILFKQDTTTGTTTTTQVLSQMDILMPQYYANPSVYEYTHPLALLILHPFYNQTSSSWTSQQYYTSAESNCY